MDFRIEPVIEELKKRRKIFVSEADFQLEMAWVIKEMYKGASVRLEYCPKFDPSMHLDILVIINGEWYPIELKYKTIGCEEVVDDEAFYLKNQAAQPVGRYLYLADIERIEKVKKLAPNFKRGYTMMITNDASYVKHPKNNKVKYFAFEIGDGALKTGKMTWPNGSSGWKSKGIDKPIVLEGKYEIHWQEYSVINDKKTGTFKYNVNVIE